MKPRKPALLTVFLALTLMSLSAGGAPQLASAQSETSFLSRVAELGQTTNTVLGDLDHDGDLDLLQDGLQLRLNDGAGRFGGPTPLQILNASGADTIIGASPPALGDADGDGTLDIFGAGGVLLNRGDAAFRPKPYALGGALAAVADFDGDGDLDALSRSDEPRFRLHRNGGDGSFTPWTDLSATRAVSGTVGLGDLNGDGAQDLAFGDGSVIFTDGAGAALATAELTLPQNTYGGVREIEIGDLNGDEAPDLAYLFVNQAIYVSLNGGAGTFGPLALVENVSLPTTFTLGDIDNDRDLDIVSGQDCIHRCFILPQRSLYLNNGAGVFSEGPTLDYGHGRPSDVTLGDLDGDGDLELIISSGVTPLYQNLAGSSEPAPLSLGSTPEATPRVGVTPGDVDSDGDIDLFFGDQLFVNDGQGGFVRRAGPGLGDAQPTLGDLDGDGDLDALAGTGAYRNDGTGLLSPYATLDADATGAALGDLDGDSDLDAIFAAGEYHNDGSGGLTRRATLTGGGAHAALGDLDQDGDLDALVADGPLHVQTFHNDSAGLLVARGPAIKADGDISGIRLGDLNGDGYLDAVLGAACASTGPCPARNAVLLNDRAGTLTFASFVRPQGASTTDLALGDYDGDGDLDVFLASAVGYPFGGEQGGVFANDGKGSFSRATSVGYWLRSYGLRSALADLDQDGDLDAVVQGGEYSGTRAELYLNTRQRRARQGAVTLSTRRPGPGASAPLLSAATIHSGPVVEVPFVVGDPEGDPLRLVQASYSLDGGAVWRRAVPAQGARVAALPTLREHHRAPLAAPLPLPDIQTTTSALTIAEVASRQPVTVTDIKVRLNIEHTAVGDLRATLRGPDGTRVTLFDGAGGESDNMRGLLLDDGATTPITAATAPITGRLRPLERLAAFRGRSPFGQWALELTDRRGQNVGRLLGWSLEVKTSGIGYVFPWDLVASGVTGFSDNVVVRIEAFGGGGRPQRHAPAAATTDPFRVRGLHPRALDTEGRPVPGALIYRLPAGQEFGAALIPSRQPGLSQLTTDANGYLQGRPPLALGDRLIALRPAGRGEALARFHTSAAPTEQGLDLYEVGQPGVQPLVVRLSQPLMLLDLEISLEWDARRDAQFLAQLERELRRASDLLFDWSDGQVALGALTVRHDRARWDDAHIRIYASNRVRPNAVKGGIVGTERADPSTAVVDRYLPGQIRIGSVWNRFGEATSALSDDWARAFAHEIGHFALFLDDNYLGFDQAGRLISADTCPGAMTDPYRDDFSEFHPDKDWAERCAQTLSQRTVGRADWATIKAFHDDSAAGWALNAPAAFNVQPGPTRLPLSVTTVTFTSPPSPAASIDPPVYLLSDAQGGMLSPLPGRGARAFLFQRLPEAQGGDRLTDLGRPVVDQVVARGARPGDRVCVLELDRRRLGCRAVDAPNQQIRLDAVTDWRPDIRLTPVTSATLDLEVRGLPPGLALRARLYPGSGPASPEQAVGAVEGGYRLRIERTGAAPAFEGLLHLWVDEPGLRRETVVDFRTGGNPGKGWARTAPRSNPGKGWARTAPVLSADGQAIIFTSEESIAEGQFFTLLSTDSPPLPPAWATPVSRAYRLSSTPGISYAQLSLNIGYLGDEVPRRQESGIVAYYWNEERNPPRWEALDTRLDTERNEGSALIARPGVYQLMTSLALRLDRSGWNFVPAYPGTTQPIDDALGGAGGRYTTVYGYDPSQAGSPWRLHDVDIPSWANDLTQLTAGDSYWFRVPRPTSLPIPGAVRQDDDVGQALTLPPPPATFYGAVKASLAGAEVIAKVDNAICGRATARLSEGQAVFVVHVEAAGADELAGCGAYGRAVVVSVGGERFTALWRNARPQPLTPGLAAPRPDELVYLPLTRR
jgi:subtilisin-like proprotein convertase family protein